ncbi:hypothetical protein WJX77_012498 [Trebouxia sp. C0004]
MLLSLDALWTEPDLLGRILICSSPHLSSHRHLRLSGIRPGLLDLLPQIRLRPPLSGACMAALSSNDQGS